MRWLIRLTLVVVTVLLYGSHLDRSPIYLNNDEAAFALEAHSIATTLRDTNGRLLPVYFNVYENVWYHPVIVYAMALAFTVLPFAEWATRIPTVIAAAANVVLVHSIAQRLTGCQITGLVAAVMLILTPAHFMHARLACDYLFPLPFVLAWMLCVIRWHETRRTQWLAVGSAALGVGLYTYIASVVMMPLYVAMTLGLLLLTRRAARRAVLSVIGPFLLLLIPLVLWVTTHPEMYAGMAGRYRQYNLDLVGSPAGAVDLAMLKDRLDVFVRFFDPFFLFDVAESNVMSSTYRTGVFLTAMSVFAALGMVAIARARTFGWLLVAAVFVTAPVAASLIVEAYAIDRALMLVPTGVLIAAAGFDLLFFRAGRAGQLIAVALLIWLPWQFDGFHRDYFGDYRARAAFWFNTNNRGAMTELIALHPPESGRRVYLADNIPFVRVYWPLFTRMQQREDLLARTIYFDPARVPVESIPAGSAVLTVAGDRIERELLRRSDIRAVKYTTEPDGTPTFVRFEKLD
jgi:4-amino-4-deoxy-L-arabinose transferase-like glycosyltransferase